MQNKRGVSYGNLDYWSDYCWLCVFGIQAGHQAHKPVAALAVMPAVVRLAARIASIRQL